MPARRYVIAILIAVVGMTLVSTCGGDPNAFRGTIVAPLETISAITPEPGLFATLTAQPAATQELTPAQSATPTLPPSTLTPRPLTSTPQPATFTPAPPMATSPAPASTPQPATPEGAIPAIDPRAYLDVSQQVGSLGDTWTLSDIRLGIHPQRVRIVWEMAENRNGTPLAEIVEVDNTTTAFPRRGALLDPSWGAARIDIMISDCYAYEFPLNERLPIIPPDGSPVTKIGLHPTFDDAVLGFSIGLTEPAAYEVFTLTDPVRIVIDVITQP